MHIQALVSRLYALDGGRDQTTGNGDQKEEARELFQKAYDLYSLFWAVNMKIVKTDDIKKIDEGALDNKDNEKRGFMVKLGELVKKAIDCCIE